MADMEKFQKMYGCSACKHTADADDAEKPAAVYGKSYWCKKTVKAVDSPEGSACKDWEYQA